ncbi:hypothetical protein RclHR1_10800007 [Rhizophagus clarus]|uniref:RNase H type-1 domain-containing protein n=1 Tax=Rhizophagus clarus TaxID=94130 RepID=A0A2Z6Q2L1_9GLOM|nr:hypothetical protein RclHR1_10800007 [Rhizophagus clarus]
MIPHSTTACLISISHAHMNDDIWINRWISPLVDRDSLLNIKSTLTYFNELSLYTDGSVQNGVLYHLGRPLDDCIDHRSMVINQALLVCPIGCRVKIYTDSQCVILSINRFLFSRSNFRSHGFNNSLILIYIDILIKDRKLDVELIKIKAYARNPWNELADDLAKKWTEVLTHHQLTFNFGS